MQKYIRHLQFIPLALLLTCSLVAGAQTITANINGTVTDPTGAVVPNAKVSATNVDTGIDTETTTNSDGIYNIRFLQIGSYKVSIVAAGFATPTYGPFVLETGQNAKIDSKLALEGNQAKVSVESELVPLINTESPVLSTTLDTRAIENMPLVSRNIVALTMFLPGAIATQPNNFVGQAAVSGPISSNTTVSVNANRQQTNQYLLDGMNINQTLDDIPGYNPSVDAIGEVKVISANAPAEYGNVLGGDILYQTKSGTNQFHGSAFYFLSDDALNANTWANKRNASAIVHVIENRGLNVISFGEFVWPSPTRSQLRLLLANLEVFIHTLVLLFADQRTHLRLAFQRRAQFDLLRFFGHGIDEVLIYRLLHQDAAARGTYLALIDEDTKQRPVNGSFKIGVCEEDVRRFAAEFERHALYSVRSLFHDDLAHSRTAGEGNLVHIGMLNERSAATLAKSGHDVDDSWRQSAVGEVLREFQSRERGLLCGLEHAGTPGSNRRRKFPGRHEHRIVPGDNLPRHADGLLK